MRQFRQGPSRAGEIVYLREDGALWPGLLYEAESLPSLVVSAGDLRGRVVSGAAQYPGFREGALVIVNCSASDETIGKAAYRRSLIEGQSARLICGYVYANAGEGESTTDLVFGRSQHHR